jgi:hypothetical protein
MSKQIDELKKQLVEISDVVNSFKSEAVQVRVVDRLLDAIIENERSENIWNGIANKRSNTINATINSKYDVGGVEKKLGATKILNQILHTDYFDTPHSIAAIAEYCKEFYASDFKTSELSGILLKMANEHKLVRQRNLDNNRFEYIRAKKG